MKKVFIDGSAGTTGLRIRERLAQRRDLEVVTLPDEVRKDVEARQYLLSLKSNYSENDDIADMIAARLD